MEDTATLSYEEEQKTRDIIEKNNSDINHLVRMLQDIQAELGYVPAGSQKILAKKMRVSVSYIYGLVSFYNFFRLYPPGEHTIKVCLGTACYVKGSKNILKALSDKYNISSGQTTKDRKFSLDTVRCFGCCALGPVMTVDDNLHGRVNPTKALEILKMYR